MTNYTVKATSVVELSLNRFFKRQYSRLLPAIGGYFPSRQHNKNTEQERSKAREGIERFLFESAI